MQISVRLQEQFPYTKVQFSFIPAISYDQYIIFSVIIYVQPTYYCIRF